MRACHIRPGWTAPTLRIRYVMCQVESPVIASDGPHVLEVLSGLRRARHVYANRRSFVSALGFPKLCITIATDLWHSWGSCDLIAVGYHHHAASEANTVGAEGGGQGRV